MTDLISVIVPIYNVENYLPRCIDSIINQTYKNLELILVDDESPDNCGKICDEYAVKDSRIKVIHQKNKGLSGARNTGIDAATGDFLAFVDSDDYIDLSMYETLMNAIKETDSDIAICGRYYEFEDGHRIERYKHDDNLHIFSGEEAIKEMNSYSSFDMAAWDKLYKKEVFEDIRYPEGKLSEDFFIIFKLFDRAKKVVYNPKPLYFYIQRNNSISRNKKINWDFIEASERQLEFMEEKHKDLVPMAKVANASANMTVYNFHIKSNVKCDKTKQKWMQSNVKKYLKEVKESSSISKIKKMQAYLFVYALPVYKVTFKVLRSVKEV